MIPYLDMNARVVIGNVTFKNISSYHIEESVKELGDSASIILPRQYKKLKGKPLLDYINTGDVVQIYSCLLYTSGIARKKNPQWKGWKIVDELKAQRNFPDNLKNHKLLNDLVPDFFKEVFWDTNNLDAVNNQAIANEMYDTGVNAGSGYAAISLQRALNVTNICLLYTSRCV